ncbi:inositol monophosphatase family protein [Actinoplanes derwentensis]|uniref:Myo-inositol-1(Or 4)-monophosphatase n=1 Tax=Actinoplanes derwentensis TaxID=113562 RepID=A0A1H1YDW4_9ACTN|nr:inositol monophosphatase family protein [Actinoplanes derwentensis]GID81104.1 inositol phosphatase [Actinoplanes derwentensis]SDT19545.1 myo-inositol-1(or 4)-monophosphatase [Actinoplanes derwentensis]
MTSSTAAALSASTDLVRTAGALLLERYSPGNRPRDLYAAVRANDDIVTALLQPGLLAALPGSGWEEDEHATGPIAGGDHWVVDPVGGNMNHVHGMPDWNIGVSLVRDGRPAFAVLYAPLFDEMYTASDGGGAFLNDVPITVSAKTDLALALTGTGQARPGHSPEVTRRFGDSIATMMQNVLYVRSSVPVGHQLAQVAAGRMDAHWQFENVRSHIGPVLLAREAGATVTDLDGKPWEITSSGYLAAAPGVHAAALTVLQGAL